jgi:hypothetical protein
MNVRPAEAGRQYRMSSGLDTYVGQIAGALDMTRRLT